MGTLFEIVLQMSINGAIVICVVLLARLLLQGLPKKYSYLLWSVAGLRLCCPFALESIVSIFNLKPLSRAETMLTSGGAGNAAVPFAGAFLTSLTDVPVGQVRTALPEPSAIPAQTASAQGATFAQIVEMALPWLWLAGMALMLAYIFVQYRLLARRMKDAVCFGEGVWASERVSSPFVLGVLRPRIMIHYGLSKHEFGYVLRHEQAHIKRRDYLVKLFAICLLAVHWFNPFCWLAYCLMNRDMEMSCDELVLNVDGSKIKSDYSMFLLSFARSKLSSPVSPVNFGQSEVKTRVKNILKYKRPALLSTVLAMALCLGVAVGCVTGGVTQTASNSDISASDTASLSRADRADCPDLLASYTTAFNPANSARAGNIAAAAAYINGTRIEPGEQFSFNNTVGERTPDRGFFKAAVYASEANTEDYGGGVSQAASTLCYAFVLADLEIVERTSHLYSVSYMADEDGFMMFGADATVEYGKTDLRVKNTKASPIVISAECTSSSINFNIYGTDDGYTACYKMQEESVTGYPTIYRKPAADRRYQAGQLGRTVHAYRVVYHNGEEVSRNREHTATYLPISEIIYTNDIPDGLEYDVSYGADEIYGTEAVQQETPSLEEFWYSGEAQKILADVPYFDYECTVIKTYCMHVGELFEEIYEPLTESATFIVYGLEKGALVEYKHRLIEAGFNKDIAGDPDSTSETFIAYTNKKRAIGVQVESYHADGTAACIVFFERVEGFASNDTPVPKG